MIERGLYEMPGALHNNQIVIFSRCSFLLFAQQSNGHFQSVQAASDNYVYYYYCFVWSFLWAVAKKATLHHCSLTAKHLAVKDVK
jgi:hypothetical protein